jgi:hypothetical protein
MLINVFRVEKFFGGDTFGAVLVMEDNFLQLFQWKILELVLDSNTIIHLLLLIIFYTLLLYALHYCQQFYCHLSVLFKRFISINQPFTIQMSLPFTQLIFTYIPRIKLP